MPTKLHTSSPTSPPADELTKFSHLSMSTLAILFAAAHALSGAASTAVLHKGQRMESLASSDASMPIDVPTPAVLGTETEFPCASTSGWQMPTKLHTSSPTSPPADELTKFSHLSMSTLAILFAASHALSGAASTAVLHKGQRMKSLASSDASMPIDV